MGYFPPETGDVTTSLATPSATTLVGTANVESIIRANTLNQLATATGNYSMGGFRTTSQGAGILSTDSASVGQGFGAMVMPFVVSGCVWTADSVGSSLNGSMTSGTVMIKGILLTVAAVTAHAFTASNDTYIDLADNGDGTANITYTGVANNGLSPALANSGTVLNTIRVAVIVTAAGSIANADQVNQGSVQFATRTSLGSSTVAAGSNGQAIGSLTSNQLAVASGAAFSTAGGWIQVAHASGQTYTLRYTGVSTNNLTGITAGNVISGGTALTVATGDTVAQVFPLLVSDLLGNRIYPTNGVGGLVAYATFTNTYTTALTTQFPIPSLIAPFVVPPGPNRAVKFTLNLPNLSSSATAGSTMAATVAINNGVSGGQGVAGLAGKISVTSDGWIVNVAAPWQLAAGTYTAQATATQGAAGTMTVGATYNVNLIAVELV